MGNISLQVPVTGQPNSTEDPKIASSFTTLQTVINGNLDGSNLATGVALLLKTTGTARKVAWGGPISTSVGLDATSGRSKLQGQQAHGLGTTPVIALLIPQAMVAIQEGPGLATPAMGVDSLDGTYIHYNATVNGTSNNGFAFYWLVIG